jgi:hypothetical protein
MLHTTSDRRLPTITNNQRGLSGGADPVVQTFVSSTYANITDVAQVSALNYLVTSLKENGLWDRIRLLYPFVGGNATSHRFNLIDPALYAITFTGSFVHNSSGISGTASASATATTGFLDADLDITNLSFGYYGTWNSTGQITFGNTTSSSGQTYMFAGSSVRVGSGTTTSVTTSSVGLAGLQAITNISGTTCQVFRNQFSLGNFTRGTSLGATAWIIQLSRSADVTINQMKLAWIGDAYTEAEMQIFNDIIDGYQVLLSRSDYTINQDFNPFTNRFLNTVGFANVDSGQQYGLNYLIENLINSGVWTKILYLYPVVGTSAATQVRDVRQLGTATLSGSFTHTTAGMDPQTTTSLMNANATNWNTSGFTQGFVATYINEQNTTNGYDFSGTTSRLLFQATTGTNTSIGVFGGTNATVANTTTTGFWLVDIAGLSSAAALYKDGASFRTYTSGANNSTIAPYFFALSTPASGSLRRSALMAWGATRLTASEITDFNTYVQQYQTLLGRA